MTPTKIQPPSSNIFKFFAIFVVGWAVYANSLYNDFHYDDSHTVVANPYVKDLSLLGDIFVDGRASSSLPENSNYRPLSTLMFSLCWNVAGGQPWPFHVWKILLHIGVAWLIYLICLSLLDTTLKETTLKIAYWKDRYLYLNSQHVVFLSVLIFLVHPGLTETLNYISATSTLQAAFFYLLAFWCFLKTGKSKKYLLPMALFYFASMLSKEEGITLPAVIVLYVLVFKNRDLSAEKNTPKPFWMPWIRSHVAAVVVSSVAMMGFAATYFLIDAGSSSASRAVMPWTQYFFTQIYAWFYYQIWIVMPWGYAIDHTGFGFNSKVYEPRVLLGIAVFAFQVFCAVQWVLRVSRRRLLPAFGIGWYYLTILPASSVVTLAEPINEHRYYIPYTIFFPALGILFFEFFSKLELFEIKMKLKGRNKTLTLLKDARKPYLATLALVLTLTGLSAVTIHRNTFWLNSEILWKDAIDKDPADGRANNNYGTNLLLKAQYAEALFQFQECARKWPQYKYCFVNQYIVLNKMGRSAEAKAALDKTLTLEPNFLQGLEWMGFHYINVELNLDKAAEYLIRCRDASGRKYAPCLKMLSDVAQKKGDLPLFRQTLQDFVEIEPRNRDALFALGMAYISEKNYVRATGVFKQILENSPGDMMATYNVAWIEIQQGNLLHARDLLLTVVKTKPDDRASWQNLKVIADQLGDKALGDRASQELGRLPAQR